MVFIKRLIEKQMLDFGAFIYLRMNGKALQDLDDDEAYREAKTFARSEMVAFYKMKGE